MRMSPQGWSASTAADRGLYTGVAQSRWERNLPRVLSVLTWSSRLGSGGKSTSAGRINGRVPVCSGKSRDYVSDWRQQGAMPGHAFAVRPHDSGMMYFNSERDGRPVA